MKVQHPGIGGDGHRNYITAVIEAAGQEAMREAAANAACWGCREGRPLRFFGEGKFGFWTHDAGGEIPDAYVAFSAASRHRCMSVDIRSLPPVPAPIRHQTHCHIKRGSTYTVERQGAEVQTSRPIVEGDMITVYVGTDGKAWARLDEEFNDGRFEVIEAPIPDRPEIDKAEFGERFTARMVDRIGPTFDDGTSVADYARQIAPSAWDADWQRDAGPEACADVNIEYMCEG